MDATDGIRGGADSTGDAAAAPAVAMDGAKRHRDLAAVSRDSRREPAVTTSVATGSDPNQDNDVSEHAALAPGSATAAKMDATAVPAMGAGPARVAPAAARDAPVAAAAPSHARPSVAPDQPTLNIGLIGHVAHGKSTLQKSLSFKRTQQHRIEAISNKTIKLGYSASKIYRCLDASCPTPGCYQAGPTKSTKVPKCRTCHGPSKLVRHVSFVDCPGHEALMATMLNGATVMDAAILVVAANERCPQPQTAEHLSVMDAMGMQHMVVVQNKTELVDAEGARDSLDQIRAFVAGTAAEGCPIIPMSAQLGINVDALAAWIGNLPDPSYPDTPATDIVHQTPASVEVAAAPAPRASSEPAQMLVVRSFDVNKPGCSPMNLVGGVAGGSVTSGSLRVGQLVEVRPGLVGRGGDGSFVAHPLLTKVTSLHYEASKLTTAVRGGLIGVGTLLDPSYSGRDKLVGQILGDVGTLPEVYSALVLMTRMMKRVPGATEADAGEDREPSSGGKGRKGRKGRKKAKGATRTKYLPVGEHVRLHVNASTVTAKVVRVDKASGKTKLELSAPVCAAKGQRVAISRMVDDQWRLVGYGDLRRGTAVAVKLPPGYDAALAQVTEPASAAAPPPPPATPASTDTSTAPPVPTREVAGPEELGEDSPGPTTGVPSTGAGAGAGAGAVLPAAEPDAHDYEGLLARLRATLEKRHGSLLNSKRVKVPPLQMFSDGPKRTVWANFVQVAEAVGRPPSHLVTFVSAELQIDAVVDGQGRLVLSGHWKPKRVMSLVRRYTSKYVVCGQCKRAHTTLRHDAALRLDFLDCSDCHASSSLAAISRGFTAVKRGERRQARQAAGK